MQEFIPMATEFAQKHTLLAGIRGIRLMRAANSTYQPMPTLGGYGEEVLINSSY